MHMPLEAILIICGVMLLFSIFASKASTKLGVPALVLFIGLGMIAGSDSWGGINFDDSGLAKELGTVALAFILFAGGLETKWNDIRGVLWSGISLATVGVLVTAAIVGATACALLGFPPLLGALLGAIVSSTDAAAVFGVLKSKGIHLKPGLMPLLELESGSNDPMAVFLTMSITDLIVHPETSVVRLVPMLILSMAMGGLVGYLFGVAGAWLINRLRLESAGLYPAVTIAVAMLSFGVSWMLLGNEFLSIYVTGVTLNTRNFLNKQSLIRFHEGLAWLMQIAMFVMLGLLVFPTKLMPLIGPGLIIAAVLVLVARPVAVFLALLRAKWMGTNDKLFVSWTGLRGAVPIILATIPVAAKVPRSDELFNIVFFAVLVSVLFQGTFIGQVASRLQVTGKGSDSEEHQARNMVELVLADSSPAVGRQVVDLKLPRWALLLMVTRDGDSFVPQGSTELRAGDKVLLATRKEDLSDLSKELGGTESSMGASKDGVTSS